MTNFPSTQAFFPCSSFYLECSFTWLARPYPGKYPFFRQAFPGQCPVWWKSAVTGVQKNIPPPKNTPKKYPKTFPRDI